MKKQIPLRDPIMGASFSLLQLHCSRRLIWSCVSARFTFASLHIKAPEGTLRDTTWVSLIRSFKFVFKENPACQLPHSLARRSSVMINWRSTDQRVRSAKNEQEGKLEMKTKSCTYYGEISYLSPQTLAPKLSMVLSHFYEREKNSKIKNYTIKS